MNATCCHECLGPHWDAPILESITSSAKCRSCVTGDQIFNNASYGKILTRTYTDVAGVCTIKTSCSGPGLTETRSVNSSDDGCSLSDTRTLTSSTSADCINTSVYSGSGNFSSTNSEGQTTSSAWSYDSAGNRVYSSGSGSGSCGTTEPIFTRSIPANTPDSYTQSMVRLECPLSFAAYPPWDTEYLGDPNPPFLPDQWRGEAWAYKSWGKKSPDGEAPANELGYSKDDRKLKYRIRHLPTGTCYLKIWIRRETRIYADASASPPIVGSTTISDTETYEWIATGNPCFPDPAKGRRDLRFQSIFSDPVEVLPPASNGIIFVSILKWSCVAGYNPDRSDPDNNQPNGYPDLTWLPAAP